MKELKVPLFLFALVLIFFTYETRLYAQSSADLANRSTAVRCLKLAKDYVNENQWDAAVSQINLGLAYDNSISDLWFLLAVSRKAQGATVAEVLQLVSSALSENVWVDYNKSGARLLYADLLSDTGKYADAVGILDGDPFLYSADAEYIRIKSYYRMQTDTFRNRARDKIESASRIYPDDMRFPLVFFHYEAALEGNNTRRNARVRQIADSFIHRIQGNKNTDAELEMYCILFSPDENQTVMLKAFAARGYRHPLYAIAALNRGLINQQDALDYFFSFAGTSVTRELLDRFAPLITEPEVADKFASYLTAYEGVISVDTDGNLEPDLFIGYKRGRPASVKRDTNSDGDSEWIAECDFGTPLSLTLNREAVRIDYDGYPSVSKIGYYDSDGKNFITFTMSDRKFMWAPFTMETDQVLREVIHYDFYIPAVIKNIQVFDRAQLFKEAVSYDVMSGEYDGAQIHFTLQDGKIQSAVYSRNKILYARAVFKDGLPVARSVDKDGDGIFETTEVFGYDPENKMHCTDEERNRVSETVYGHTAAESGIYLKMIQIDRNEDTIPDYTEEYLADGGKISSWDQDNDGFWDVRYVKYPHPAGDPVPEDFLFYTVPGHALVTVSSVDGKPVKVISDNVQYPVEQGDSQDFYWIGAKGTLGNEKETVGLLNQTADQGICIIVHDDNERILAVRVGKNKFAKLLPDTETNGINNETEQKK